MAPDPREPGGFSRAGNESRNGEGTVQIKLGVGWGEITCVTQTEWYLQPELQMWE